VVGVRFDKVLSLGSEDLSMQSSIACAKSSVGLIPGESLNVPREMTLCVIRRGRLHELSGFILYEILGIVSREQSRVRREHQQVMIPESRHDPLLLALGIWRLHARGKHCVVRTQMIVQSSPHEDKRKEKEQM
jgi:hypothetical protein